jgi:hypothetical protein
VLLLIKKRLICASHGKNRRESQAYSAAHEHFETAFNAGIAPGEAFS